MARDEDILQATIDGEIYDKPAESRIEALLKELNALIISGIGSGVSDINFSINESTFVISAELVDEDGNVVGTTKTVDLPLESVVVDGSYNSLTQTLILTLKNGNTISIPISDLINGLQEEITSQNKLDADLVDDSNSTNKFTNATEKQTWNSKQEALSQAQMDAANSGIDSATLLQIETDISSLETLTDGIDSTGDNFIEINGVKLYFGSTTPSNPSDGDWWLD